MLAPNVDALKPFQIELTCSKCMRFGRFSASSEEECMKQAIIKGWARDDERFICPRCPVLANRGGDHVA